MLQRIDGTEQKDATVICLMCVLTFSHFSGSYSRFRMQYFNNPITTELLPPRVQQHPQAPLKPYTLLISLDDLLITSTWDVSLFGSRFASVPYSSLHAASARLEDRQATWSGLFPSLYITVLRVGGFYNTIFLCKASRLSFEPALN